MVSFAKDIKPLFTARDLNCMKGEAVYLGDYAYMSDPSSDSTFPDYAHARNVFAHLNGTSEPRMPMGGPFWSDAQIKLFESWMSDGFKA